MGPEKTCGHPRERMRQEVRGSQKRGWVCLECRQIKQRENRRTAPVRPKVTAAPRVGRDMVAGTPPPVELAAGLCVDMDDTRFIQPPSSLSDFDRHALMKACGNCPVRALCKDWADQQTFFEGVAGGYTYSHRQSKRVINPLTTHERIAS